VGSFFEPLGSGPPALAKAYGKVEANKCIFTCNHFCADTSIDFDRAFRLEGSPSGQWSVGLVTLLRGQILAGGHGSPEASVDASVTIATLSDPATPIPFFSVEFHHDDTVSKSDILNDGTYLVHGSLGVHTEASEERTGDSGLAEANFFDLGPDLLAGLVVAGIDRVSFAVYIVI
jgi:hypothetical protein